MLNKHKAAKAAARALLGLSLAHFDGEDTLEQPAAQRKTPFWTVTLVLVLVLYSALQLYWRRHAG